VGVAITKAILRHVQHSELLGGGRLGAAALLARYGLGCAFTRLFAMNAGVALLVQVAEYLFLAEVRRHGDREGDDETRIAVTPRLYGEILAYGLRIIAAYRASATPA